MTHTSRTVPKMIEGSLRRSTAANAMSDGCSATARPRTRAARGQHDPGDPEHQRRRQGDHGAVHHLQPEQIGVEITDGRGEQIVVRDVVAPEGDHRMHVQVKRARRQLSPLREVGRGVGTQERAALSRPKRVAGRHGQAPAQQRPDEEIQARAAVCGILGGSDQQRRTRGDGNHEQIGGRDAGQELGEQQRDSQPGHAHLEEPRMVHHHSRPSRAVGRDTGKNSCRPPDRLRPQRALRDFRQRPGMTSDARR